MLFFLSVYPLLRTLVEHWEAKNGDISINNWKHMKSNFTYAVMEQEAALPFLQNNRSKSEAGKGLVGEAEFFHFIKSWMEKIFFFPP